VTDETSNQITYDAAMAGQLTVASSQIQALQLAPAPVICAHGDNGLIWAVHPDGRIELGDGYSPDEAAASFWDAVRRLQPNPMVQQYGAPLTARINAELKAGQEAERKVQRLDQMAEAWAERLPDTIRTATAVEAIHHITRGDR